MKTKIARWGNSLAVRLPKAAVQRLGLADGTHLEVATEEGKIVLTPRAVEDPELAALIAKITPKNRYPETDWGKREGREAW